MRLAIVTSCTIAMAIVGIVVYDRLPAQHSPLASFDPQRPVGMATGWQIGRLDGDRAACHAALDRAGLRTVAIADSREGEFCGFTDAVAVERSSIPWSEAPLRLTCPMVVALAVWERQVVAPAAERHLGTRVVRIQHFGTYSCRRVAGGASGRPSQHATANAIDVGAFQLANGRRVTVKGDWGKDTAEAAFLREVHDGSCRVFRAVLGPDYNAAHADHLHLDMGPYPTCS